MLVTALLLSAPPSRKNHTPIPAKIQGASMTFERVKVEWKILKQYFGWAYPDERRVEIATKITDRQLLRIKPHEYAHIYFPEIPEYRIKAFGSDLGRSLYFDDGFRRSKGEE